jgi:hypothetical protein
VARNPSERILAGNENPPRPQRRAGVLLSQSLPPRALAVSAHAPSSGGFSWSHAHGILQLWVEVEEGCGLDYDEVGDREVVSL